MLQPISTSYLAQEVILLQQAGFSGLSAVGNNWFKAAYGLASWASSQESDSQTYRAGLLQDLCVSR